MLITGILKQVATGTLNHDRLETFGQSLNTKQLRMEIVQAIRKGKLKKDRNLSKIKIFNNLQR